MYLRKAYDAEADALMRCPFDSHRIADWGPGESSLEAPTRAHARLRSLANVLWGYCDAFGLPRVSLAPQSDADRIIARRDRLRNDPKRIVARAKSEAKREAEVETRRQAYIHREAMRHADMAEKLQAWLRGESVPYFSYREPVSGSALLRLKGDKVETSLGATAPIMHAITVLRFYDRLRDPQSGCTSWIRPDDERREATTLGHFRLDAVNADGSVKAGCHLISAEQIERLRGLIAERNAAVASSVPL